MNVNAAEIKPEIKRELLGSAIIAIAQPPQYKKFTAPDGTPYEQFGHFLTGGFLNCHIYDRDKCVARGKKLLVRAEVWMKTMEHGQQFLYVDLHPTDKSPTHDRKIYQHTRDIPKDLPEGSTVFNTLGHIKGAIAFIPRSAD